MCKKTKKHVRDGYEKETISEDTDCFDQPSVLRFDDTFQLFDEDQQPKKANSQNTQALRLESDTEESRSTEHTNFQRGAPN